MWRSRVYINEPNTENLYFFVSFIYLFIFIFSWHGLLISMVFFFFFNVQLARPCCCSHQCQCTAINKTVLSAEIVTFRAKKRNGEYFLPFTRFTKNRPTRDDASARKIAIIRTNVNNYSSDKTHIKCLCYRSSDLQIYIDAETGRVILF